MKELLSKIGISSSGEFSEEGNYVVDFENSQQFNKAFSRLDKSDLVDENEDASVTNLDVSNVMYESDKYALNLIADFSQDIYKLVVSEIDKKEEE